MLDYAALSALAAVVREGSFERAAQALHVTPSAISQRIRLLEERMGCALVLRGQPCLPTEAGRRLCQHVDHVRLLEQDLHGSLPALGALARDGRTRVPLPVARIVAVIIIIATGLALAFGDTSGGFRKLIQIVFGLSIAFAASSFFLSFFSFSGGAVV